MTQEIDDKIGAQAIELFKAINIEEEPATPEAGDYSNQKFWSSVEFDLELLVWAVINDGVITGDEIRLLMSVLESHGVPDNDHTRAMLRAFLEREMEQYKHEYQQLSPEEKQRRLDEEEDIKEEISRRLRQMQEQRLQKTQTMQSKDMKNRVLSGDRKIALAQTMEKLVMQMGFKTKKAQDASLMAQFNKEKFEKKQKEFLSR